MWAYVREHDRMDPKDKRFAIIEGDANLERVFKGKRRLQMFGYYLLLFQLIIRILVLWDILDIVIL